MRNKVPVEAAFPNEQHECQDNTWNQTFDPGMTLRDYFASKAMQTIRDDANSPYIGKDDKEAGITWVGKIAKESYELADAMLAERKPTDKP